MEQGPYCPFFRRRTARTCPGNSSRLFIPAIHPGNSSPQFIPAIYPGNLSRHSEAATESAAATDSAAATESRSDDG
jgi:hypothetical protein